MSLKTTKNSHPFLGLVLTMCLSVFMIGNLNAQESTCDTVTIVLTDSYGDGWNGNSLTVGDTDYTQVEEPGAYVGETFIGCVDLSSCVSLTYNATGSYSSENSWSVTVNATGDTYSSDALIGTCVTACTDAMADNYNANADISDNSLCEYSVLPGCMDMSACNYNPDAGQDDGSCSYADAGADCDGNCLTGFASITTTGGLFYVGFDVNDCDGNSLASNASFSSFADGCYELAENYVVTLGGEYPNDWGADYFYGYSVTIDGVMYDVAGTTIVGSCGVPGCTEVDACNYDSLATYNDGSCFTAAEGYDCEGNCLSGVEVVYNTNGFFFAYEDGYSITDCDGTELASMSAGYSSSSGCFELGDSYVVNTFDSYGDGWAGSLTIDGVDYTLYSGDGEQTVVGCPSGCTNPLANNYDASVNYDDGSCLFCYDGVEVSSLPDATLPDDVITVTIQTGDSYAGEIHWELVSDASDSILFYGGNALQVGNPSAGGFAGGDYLGNSTYTSTSACLPHGCYKLVTYDTYGDGWNDNGSFTVTNQFGQVLVPQTVMSPTSGDDPDGTGYGTDPQVLATYFTIGDGSCDTYGCTDPLASNYDETATVDDETCIFCEDGEVDVTFVFNQENITSDEVYVYNDTDTIFSVAPGELSTWEGKELITCVPVGCYYVSMGSVSSDGWTDGSQLQILDDLTSEYFLLDQESGSLDITVVSFGGGECVDDQIGGCTDAAFDNYNPDATFDNGTCDFLCENASLGNTSTAVAGNDTEGSWVYLCADADGNGATVTFEEMAENVSFNNSYIAYNLDSCDGTGSSLTYLSSTFSIDLDAGQCLYFNAQNPYNYVDSVSTIMANVFEIPDSSLWGCMDEVACNFDANATYQPDAVCEYAVAGFDCDSVELPAYIDVTLDYSASHSLCADDNDYDANNTAYDGFSSYVAGQDMAFAFVSDGSSVLSNVVSNSSGYTYLTMHVYNGNPTDSGSVLVWSEQLTGYDLVSNQTFDTDSGSTYYVVVDTYGSSWSNYCYDFDILLSALVGQGGCTDPAACNYDADASYDDFTCILPADGFDCEGNFNGSACGTDNPYIDSVAVPYDNNMYEVWTFPSNGVDPVSIVFTGGDTEGCCDDWRIYDGVGDDAISFDNLIVEFNDILENSYVSGYGNGITVLWDSDVSVNGDETYGNMVFEVYCADIVLGCMDTLAVNYSADATIDDGSCTYDFVFGCMDMSAINYNPDAVQDDGSCLTQGAMVTLPYSGIGLTNCGNGDNLDETNTSYSGYYMGGDDALYIFSVTDSGSVNIDLTNSTETYTGIIVFDGNPLLSTSEVVGSSTSSASDESIVSLPVDSGSYYVVIDTWPLPNCVTSFDLSIYLDVDGCTDANADNYNESATIDDGSCVFSLVQGCMDLTACNFDELAEQDNGSCVYFGETCDCALDTLASTTVGYYSFGDWAQGCADADGFGATVEFEGSGLTTTSSFAYWIQQTSDCDSISFAPINVTDGYSISIEAGECFSFQAYDYYGYPGGTVTASIYENPDTNLVSGCMDVLACNYDSLAEVQPFDACTYPQTGFDCDGVCLEGTHVYYDSEGGYSYDGYSNFIITSCDGEVIAEMTNGLDGFDNCVVLPENYVITLSTDFTSTVTNYWSGSVVVGDTSFIIDLANLTGNQQSIVGSCGTPGCTDPTADNFDPEATFEDGSCTYPLYVDIALPYVDSAATTCGYGDDYTSSNTSYGGSYLNGDDFAVAFDGTGNSMNIGLSNSSDSYSGIVVFDGDPLESTSSVVASSTSSSYDESLVLETNDSTTYFVVISTWASPQCIDDFVFTITENIGVGGCIDASALNYNPEATFDDGSCTYPLYVDIALPYVDSAATTCGQGDDYSSFNTSSFSSYLGGDDAAYAFAGTGNLIQLTMSTSDSYTGLFVFDGNPLDYASVIEQSTSYSSTTHSIEFASDTNTTYFVVISSWPSPQCVDFDLSIVESDTVIGCTDITACNYDSTAEYNSGCIFAESGYDCNGVCLADADEDGVCDDNEIVGCSDATALNYNELATDEGECEYCTDNIILLQMYDDYSYGGWDGATFTMTDGTNSFSASLNDGGNGTYDEELLCVPTGCYDVYVGGGSYDYEITFTLGDLLVNSFAGTYSDVSVGGANCNPVFGCTDATASNFNPDATDDDGTCEYVVFGCTDETADNYNADATDDDGTCEYTILGCTDPSADNFDPLANVDDSSCTYCASFEAVLVSSADVSEAGAADGSISATGQGGSSNYDVQVLDANDVQQNPFALSAGDYTVVVTDINNNCTDELIVTIGEPAVAVDPCDITPTGLFVDNIIHNRVTFNWDAPSAAPSYYMIRYRPVGSNQWTVMRAGPETANAFTGTSRTRYFHEAGTTYEWSMRARMVDESLATICQSPWSATAEYTTLPACANLENLSVSTEANWVTFFADAPDASWGVWQSKGKMREAGTNAFRYVNGGSDGSINGLKGNFTPSTDYEWHTKAWCTGNVDADGNPDPMYHSGWGDFSTFSTEAPCDKMPINLTTSTNGANTAVTMTWDTPESGAPDHYFLEMTNLTTGNVYQWNNIPGTDNSKTKFGQNPGDEISWRIRGACGTNGTSWATIFSQPATFTLGGARMAQDVVSGLDVYPNPSRDIFNVTFTSEEAQTISVKVVNMIGEEIYSEELTDFVGQFTKVVDMNTQPKGVYFLEITTNNGGVNHKVIVQ